jgi:hypothetical protein
MKPERWEPIEQLYDAALDRDAGQRPRAEAPKGLNLDLRRGSRKASQDFLALWKDADADLPVLIEAKKYER